MGLIVLEVFDGVGRHAEDVVLVNVVGGVGRPIVGGLIDGVALFVASDLSVGLHGELAAPVANAEYTAFVVGLTLAALVDIELADPPDLAIPSG